MKAIKDFFLGFLYTFTNDKRGNSARKTTAFALMLCVGWIHYSYLSIETATSVLLIVLNMKNLQTILIILLSGLVIWSWIKPKETVQLPPIHEIETRIEYHDTVIKQFETKVIQSSYNNSILRG
jgi:hypothetical protein